MAFQLLQPVTRISCCLPAASIPFCHHAVRGTGSDLASVLVLQLISFSPPGGLTKCVFISVLYRNSPALPAEPTWLSLVSASFAQCWMVG